MEQEDNKEDWNDNIRSDLWGNMNTQQLGVQRDLVINKIALMNKLPMDPTVNSILTALNMAYDDLNTLLDDRISQQKRTL